ncbi:hypothetical protein Exig_1476 [Exiguobacterium sibiricum 255-15]|uniref:DUF4362 domain-containing protein n=1 Tax=Exiguobacterium sibiricum (strain DSM 17290 / CCUG 55495 / CIP 109462 / JCM 13490 / 255-15) TaxID=262543 RepID=B1YG09_EXIS2|nr:DUF4362 domain-containing protein [Exiguobacterium sibiricum]ACB60936.1 hypothetical protein Exig_1476 [Exiguobacterium sibiricum 255-15]
MRKRIYLLFGVGILMLAGCASNDYPSEEAIKNGDIVTTPERANVDQFETFLQRVEANKKDTIRITNYTTEGDAILEDITYDGKQFVYSLDSSRDEYCSQADDREKEVCRNMQKKAENEGYVFTLTDCQEGQDHIVFTARPGELSDR